MQVEIAYASPDKQTILKMVVPENTTLVKAIELSGILGLYPEIVGEASAGPNLLVGIFGKLRSLDWPLKEGDRVEIYRQLLIDPMTARRNRAKQQKAKKT